MDERQRERLENWRRQARADRLRPQLLTLIKETTGAELTQEAFLNLEVTANLISHFYRRIRSIKQDLDADFPTDGIHRYWPYPSKVQLELLFQQLADQVQDQTAIFFPRDVDLVGAVEVPLRAVLKNAFALHAVTSGDVAIATPDLAAGLLWGFNYFDESGMYTPDGTWEIIAWGAFVNE